MPDQKPPAPPPAKGSKKSIVQADAESRSPKEAVVRKSPKKARQVPKTAESAATEPQVTTSIGKTVMDPKMTMQVPDSVRELAEKTVGQAERAFDAFLSAAQQSVAMIPSPANEMSKKTLALTEQNMKAAFEYARKLAHAKDIQEVMQIQSEFFKSQFAAAGEQMKQMGADAVSASKSAARDFDKS